LEGDSAEWCFTIDFGYEKATVGDIVLGVHVIPTGPNPDIDIDPEITGHIGFGSETPVELTLKQLGRLVRHIIVELAPLLKAKP
jgi:hypothetical protein